VLTTKNAGSVREEIRQMALSHPVPESFA